MLQTRFALLIDKFMIHSVRITKFSARSSGSSRELQTSRIFGNMCYNIALAGWFACVWPLGPVLENRKIG